jgi:AraC family transcriptional regulator, transcriptional activator of the genes for pyochelin and ferripyochelin receptors
VQFVAQTISERKHKVSLCIRISAYKSDRLYLISTMPFECNESILDELWQQAEEQGKVDWLDTETDEIDWGTLDTIGIFWQCFTPLENSLQLIIEKWEVAEDLFYCGDETEQNQSISLMFHLSGQVQTHHHGLTEEIAEIVGYYHLEHSHLPETELWITGTPFWRVYLNFDPLQLFSDLNSQLLVQLPVELRHIMEENYYPFYRSHLIAPQMHQILQQILHCPYQGLLRKMYLQGKAWDLLTLSFEPFLPPKIATSHLKSLKPSEIEKIHQAKDILLRNLNNPPSLIDLARQANVNDFALKQGFKQVFGTTVFRYLHDYRLQVARQLLVNSELRIEEIARQVGFVNRGYFAKVFRQKFDLKPKEYRQQRKNSL